VWHSYSCSSFELEFSCPLISIWESRRSPRLAGSLSRGANTAGTRYSSDIVVESMNERWIDRIVSKCLFVRVEQTGETAEDITVLTSICYPLSRTSLQSPRLCQEPWWQSQKWVFRPAGATRCPDKGEIWHGERTTSVPNFPLYRRKNVGTQASKLWKFRILPINLHLRGHSFPQLLRNSQLLYGCQGRFWLLMKSKKVRGCNGTDLLYHRAKYGGDHHYYHHHHRTFMMRLLQKGHMCITESTLSTINE